MRASDESTGRGEEPLQPPRRFCDEVKIGEKMSSLVSGPSDPAWSGPTLKDAGPLLWRVVYFPVDASTCQPCDIESSLPSSPVAAIRETRIYFVCPLLGGLGIERGDNILTSRDTLNLLLLLRLILSYHLLSLSISLNLSVPMCVIVSSVYFLSPDNLLWGNLTRDPWRVVWSYTPWTNCKKVKWVFRTFYFSGALMTNPIGDE